MAAFRLPYCRHCYRSSTALISPPSLSFPGWRILSAPSTGVSSMSPCSASSLAMETSNAKAPQQPWLIVGLGNPGKKYDCTRHNVGFEMVDTIAEAEGISMSSVSFKAILGKGSVGDTPVILAKPKTFMNSSGESVGAIVSYYKIPLKQVLVVSKEEAKKGHARYSISVRESGDQIFDDLDLPFGKLRLLPKGGHGGHNGMRSIIAHLKDSRDFPRLKIGIGRPPGKMDPSNFVLRPFNRHEKEELDFTFRDGLEAVRILLMEGFNKSATFANSAKCLEQHG